MTKNTPGQDVPESSRERAARVMSRADEQRRRLQRLLHDGPEPHLVLAQMKASFLARTVASDPA
jgi:signal transduction histidine kinase